VIAGRATLLGALRDGARGSPGRPYVHTQGRVRSYAEVAAMADRTGAALRAALAGKRPVIGASVRDPELLLHVIWGSVAAGVTLAFVPESRSLEHVHARLAEIGAAALVTDAPFDQAARGFSASPFHVLPPAAIFTRCDTLPPPSPRSGLRQAEPRPGPGETAASMPAFLFQTSGTTGAPKWVRVPHVHFALAVSCLLEAHGPRYEGHVAYLTPPLSHSYGLSALFEYTMAGSAVALPGSAGPFDPIAALWSPAIAPAVTAIEGVPFFYEQLSRMVERARLPALRVCGVGGGALARADAERVSARYPALGWSSRYGMTETPSVVSLKVLDPSAAAEGWGSSGRPLPLYDLRVVDEADAPVAPGCEGEILLRGAPLADCGEARPDGFYATGDVGRLDARGELFVTGRRSLFLKRRGFRVSPEYVEAAAREAPGVADCRAWSSDGALVLSIVPAAGGGGDAIRREVLRRLAGVLPPWAVPDRVETAATIPRTPSGKIVRR
jgi:acyl-CoA synthetase (AMP-forming)/AMP-acid ligase II